MSRRRRRKLTRVWISLIGAAVLAALIIVLLKGFEVHSVKVEGNSRYSSEQILSDLVTDYPSHNSLYLAWKYRRSQAASNLPYLDSVQVKLLSPGQVRIIVVEKEAIGGILYNGQYVYFDESGIALRMNDEAEEGIALVSGVSMGEPTLYKKLPATDTALLNTMIKISGLMKDTQLDVTSISFDEDRNITVTIGKVDVELGQAEYLEQKVATLVSIFDKVAGESGTLNMTAFTGNSEQITFQPREEPMFASDAESATGEAGLGSEAAGTDSTQEGSAEGDEAAEAAAEYTGENAVINGQDADDAQDQEEDQEEGTGEVTGVEGFMVFDSSGTLRYDARVIDGQVVDAYGDPIDGCTVEDSGYVKDAYWNIIDPMTGELAQ